MLYDVYLYPTIIIIDNTTHSSIYSIILIKNSGMNSIGSTYIEALAGQRQDIGIWRINMRENGFGSSE